jgi:hypothetical protein
MKSYKEQFEIFEEAFDKANKQNQTVKDLIELFISLMQCPDILAKNNSYWEFINFRFMEFSKEMYAICKLKPRWKKLEYKILRSPYYNHKSILKGKILELFTNRYKKYNYIYKNESNRSTPECSSICTSEGRE